MAHCMGEESKACINNVPQGQGTTLSNIKSHISDCTTTLPKIPLIYFKYTASQYMCVSMYLYIACETIPRILLIHPV